MLGWLQAIVGFGLVDGTGVVWICGISWDVLFCLLRTFVGLIFLLGPMVLVCSCPFFLFFPLSVRFGGLRSAEPWGCLCFLFFFSFLDIMDILDIEH